ncbi:MAG: (Fe-S)-binding protein [Vicinamibacterales bacterium]
MDTRHDEQLIPLAALRRPLGADDVQQRLRYIVEKERLVLDGLPQKFLEAFAAILKHSNYRQVIDNYARITARCAGCATACQIYQHTRDPRDVPCYRSNLVLEVYRRHFTARGLFETRVLGREYLSEDRILEMASSLYDCTACRRCSLECPLGLDHGLITHFGRYVLSEVGLVPRALVISVREQLEGATHNTSAIPLPAIVDTLEFLADEIRDEKKRAVEFPLDQSDRDFVFFPAVSDYLMEAETLMGVALTLNAIGDQDRWTIGSHYLDGINYGLFYSDWILEKTLLEEIGETRRLKGRRILIGECGHASRSAKAFARTFGGPDTPPVVHIIEHTYKAFKEGRLRLNPDVITERVTYHDPCNIARTGWVVEQPREILKAFCKDYVEMTPNRATNLCCGGGGGTVSVDELRPYRTGVTGAKKAEQLRATGAKFVVAPCANCKKQLRELCEDHGLDMQVVGLHDLIYRAIVLD